MDTSTTVIVIAIVVTLLVLGYTIFASGKRGDESFKLSKEQEERAKKWQDLFKDKDDDES